MRTCKYCLQVAILLVASVAQAAIHGDTDAIPHEPRAFCTICFPANYQTHQTSQDLLRAFAVDPAFKELRRLARVTTYAANDPDFRHRWEARLPQVRDGRPCLIISYGDAYTPQKMLYGRDIGPGGAMSVDELAADLKNRYLPILRARLQQRPQPPQFVQQAPVTYASGPYTTTYTYTYSYGRPRIRIFRPRNPDNCPDCVNPVVGPSNPIQPTDDPNAPIRPLLPPIDETVSYPPDSEPTTPPQDPNAPLIPNNPELPPAPVEPPPPDPRIDEQAEQIREQAETIKQLQQTIQQLQQTIVNVQPARDYAPDINALKGDIRDIKNAHANYQNEQNKINNDVVVSLKNVLEQRAAIATELAAIKGQLAKPMDLDKLAADIQKKLPPVKLEWTRADGKVLKQEKPLGVAMKVATEAGIKKQPNAGS